MILARDTIESAGRVVITARDGAGWVTRTWTTTEGGLLDGVVHERWNRGMQEAKRAHRDAAREAKRVARS